jgi:hypothetical protein
MKILINFIVYLIIFETQAAYLIVERDGEGKIKPSNVTTNLDYDKLNKLILENTWPTSDVTPSELKGNEKDRLLEALIGNHPDLADKYSFVWVPDTYYELSISACIMESITKNDPAYLRGGSNSYLYSEAKYDHDDTSVEKIQQMSFQEAQKNSNLKENKIRTTYQKKCQNKFVEELLKHDLFDKFEEVSTNPRFKEQLVTIIRDKMGILYKSNPNTNNYVPVYNYFKDPELIYNIISHEIVAFLEDQTLIFRGTSGVKLNHESRENMLVLDYPIEGNQGPYSLSFGTTLFAGYFNASGACALDYIRHNKLGYALKIDKKNPDVKKLFEIPKHDTFGRLFARSEYFHPRTKVGSNDWDLSFKQVKGLFLSGNTQSEKLENLNQLREVKKFSFNPDKNLFEQAMLLNNYITQNMIIVKNETELSNDDLLNNQRTVNDLLKKQESVQEILKEYSSKKSSIDCHSRNQDFVNDNVGLQKILKDMQWLSNLWFLSKNSSEKDMIILPSILDEGRFTTDVNFRSIGNDNYNFTVNFNNEDYKIFKKCVIDKSCKVKYIPSSEETRCGFLYLRKCRKFKIDNNEFEIYSSEAEQLIKMLGEGKKLAPL